MVLSRLGQHWKQHAKIKGHVVSTAACLHLCHQRELAGQQSIVCPCGMQQKRLVLLKAVVEMPLTSCFLFGFVLVSSTHGTLSPPTFASIACLVLSVRLRQHHQCNLFHQYHHRHHHHHDHHHHRRQQRSGSHSIIANMHINIYTNASTICYVDMDIIFLLPYRSSSSLPSCGIRHHGHGHPPLMICTILGV